MIRSWWFNQFRAANFPPDIKKRGQSSYKGVTTVYGLTFPLSCFFTDLNITKKMIQSTNNAAITTAVVVVGLILNGKLLSIFGD